MSPKRCPQTCSLRLGTKPRYVSPKVGHTLDYSVYCDESNPELMANGARQRQYLLIGSLWVETEKRRQYQDAIVALRRKHNIWGEMKWRKISPSSVDFYLDLVDLFLEAGDELRFRCIVVDSNTVDMRFYGRDGELGFYKFYYQVLHHWIAASNSYKVYCDLKSNRDKQRIQTLHRVLTFSRPGASIDNVQALPSSEVVLMQLCDVLLGAAHSRFNNNGQNAPAKQAVLNRIERGVGYRLRHTYPSEQKYNVFKIKLQGAEA